MNSHSFSEFDTLPRDEVLELLFQCMSRLSRTQKTILAMHYHEGLGPAEIAACVGLTEGELDRVRADTVELLRTTLAAQIGLPKLPASFDKSHKADGADIMVNGELR